MHTNTVKPNGSPFDHIDICNCTFIRVFFVFFFVQTNYYSAVTSYCRRRTRTKRKKMTIAVCVCITMHAIFFHLRLCAGTFISWNECTNQFYVHIKPSFGMSQHREWHDINGNGLMVYIYILSIEHIEHEHIDNNNNNNKLTWLSGIACRLNQQLNVILCRICNKWLSLYRENGQDKLYIVGCYA